MDELNLSMFKSSDIRTKEENLNPVITRRLLGSVAFYLKEIVHCDTIVLAHDARLGVPALMQQALDLYPNFGLNLIVNPLQSSTPQFYFACMQNPKACGIMFTASHNSAAYVGMKLLIPPMIPLAENNGPEGGLCKIKELYLENNSPKPVATKGKITVRRYLDHYIDYSLKLSKLQANSLNGLNILCDFLSGAAGTEVTEALAYCGANVMPLHIVPDGRFPVGDPNPIILTSITEAQKRMKQESYDFGLLFDGDGDRMDLMTRDSQQLSPSFNFGVILPEIMKTYGKISVLVDAKVNPYAQAHLANCAKEVGLVKNGHSHIKKALFENRELGYYAACEESGHYYLNFPYNPKDFQAGFAATENTLYFALLTARMQQEKPEAYKTAFELQEKTIREREWTKHFNSKEEALAVMKEIEKTFTKLGATYFDKDFLGKNLEAALMRYNTPRLDESWYQVFQRLSQSEDNVVRWEITGSDKNKVRQAKEIIDQISK